ncbi:MAG: MarR family transcriptional regulator [Chloroflexi bacterium]|nr:MarR family transcriptional regulator [Chloroflexota bacterium]
MTTNNGNDVRILQDVDLRFEEARAHPTVRTFFWLLRCGDVLGRYVDSKMAKRSSNRTRLAVADCLLKHGEALPQRDVAADIFRTTQATAKVIDSLERDGLVERIPDPSDRRINKVRLTRRGVDNLREVFPEMLAMCDEAMSCLTETEIVQLQDLVYKVNKNLRQRIERDLSDE